MSLYLSYLFVFRNFWLFCFVLVCHKGSHNTKVVPQGENGNHYPYKLCQDLLGTWSQVKTQGSPECQESSRLLGQDMCYEVLWCTGEEKGMGPRLQSPSQPPRQFVTKSEGLRISVFLLFTPLGRPVYKVLNVVSLKYVSGITVTEPTFTLSKNHYKTLINDETVSLETLSCLISGSSVLTELS